MGFLKRLLSIGGKKKRKDGKKGMSKKNPMFSGSTLPISEEQDVVDEDVLVNRLLRSSSTHFSVISQGTEYRSMPPIPHPINNVLRAPSIISSATQTDTYTVKVHRRMLHSRTEFPNANRSGDSSSSPTGSLSRRHSLPPLTPGDKNRLARLRQDASVLSLLDIYDEKGNPNLQAFSNTPTRSERNDPSLRALMGGASTPNLGPAETGLQESDISWADRYIRAARRDSSSSSLTTSSLGIPVNLFKASMSPERLRLQDHDSETAFSSCEIDVGIDSMLVERGTVEDTSTILQPLAAALTSPTRRASQFFKFLQDDPKLNDRLLTNASEMNSHADMSSPPLPQTIAKHLPPSPRGPRPIQQHPSLSSCTVGSAVDQARLSRNDADLLFVRDGPKQSHAQVSPPPRRHSRLLPLPPVPVQHLSQATKSREPKPTALGLRAPFEELRNADARYSSSRNVSAAPTSRSVSVASSVYPRIETKIPDVITDPYTPLPPRRTVDGRKGHVPGENVPPNAPARPVRGQSRAYAIRNGARPARSKESSDPQVFAPSNYGLGERLMHSTDPDVLPSKESPAIPVTSTEAPPATPSKNPAREYLQTPSRPSPASSSELSPQGRQIMAHVRERARKASHSKTPRSWQSWGGKGDPCEV